MRTGPTWSAARSREPRFLIGVAHAVGSDAESQGKAHLDCVPGCDLDWEAHREQTGRRP